MTSGASEGPGPNKGQGTREGSEDRRRSVVRFAGAVWLRRHSRLIVLLTLAWLAALITAAALSGQERAGLVVDAAWLSANLSHPDLVVLQVGRAEAPEGPFIPGAVPINLNDLAVTSNEEGETRIALDLPADLTPVRSAFEAAGVSDDSRVVVVFGESRVPDATRTLWTLDVLGLGERSSLLDGGLEAWKASGGALADAPGEPQPGRITAAPRLDRRVDGEFVLDRGAGPGVTLLDARREASYDGSRPEMEGRAGHIPGAASLHYAHLYTEDGALRPTPELRALFEAAGYAQGDQVVAYCHIGYWASAVVFAARTLGMDARLYDGSMTEWAQDASLPLVLPEGM
jgi:thiosulfate/3-mercaptopyruvate sulfurtransferase